MELSNKKFREYCKVRKIPFWRIAESLGISEMSFCRKMRTQLSDAEEKELRSVVDRIVKETA